MEAIGEIFNIILVQPLANIMVLFYNVLFQNMGLAIIGTTLFIRLALYPLTKKSIESMQKMREYQGELNKLKSKHDGDRAKQMQAQQDFYKEKGINPSAGCIPQIIQLVVLIAFFRVFTIVLSGDPAGLVDRFNELLYAPLQFAPGATINTQFLYLNVTQPDVINIPGLPFPLPGPLLIFAAITQLVSAKISLPFVKEEQKMAKKTKGMGDDLATSMQSSMVYTFPLITLVIGVGFPSGLVLYWMTFSIWQTLQQYKSFGWGGMTPLLARFGLIQLPDSNKRKSNKQSLKQKRYDKNKKSKK